MTGRNPHPGGEIEPPRLTFDTNAVSLVNLRAFWGTVCESVGTRLTLTETAFTEVLRFERQNVQWDWEKRLRAIRRAHPSIQLDPKSVRRNSQHVAREGVEQLQNAFRDPRVAPYAYERATSDKNAERHFRLLDEVPERFFDMRTDAGKRDHKIVVEAFTSNFDLLISNNINTINHIGIGLWLASGNAERLAITTQLNTCRAQKCHPTVTLTLARC